MSETTPGAEHTQIKGFTIKNMVVTVICAMTICTTGLKAYQGIIDKMNDNNANQNTYNKITDLRLKAMEDRQAIIEIQLEALKKAK